LRCCFITFVCAHQPQAQPLKVARRELTEGRGVSCAGESRLWDGVGPGSGVSFCVQGDYVMAWEG
jgi:hypothetical protein